MIGYKRVCMIECRNAYFIWRIIAYYGITREEWPQDFNYLAGLVLMGDGDYVLALLQI
jgi:hypothetical protein